MGSQGQRGSGSKPRIGRYELGKLLGLGTLAKVRFARNTETGENVAIKIIDKEKVLKRQMITQIKREIVTMKHLRHPNVIRTHEPENLLLDASRVLKVSGFGFSALPQQVSVILKKGYDGAKADVWSCGVILFLLLAGYLPFHDSNLMAMTKQITKADVKCPPWFSSSVKELVKRILDPTPATDTRKFVVAPMNPSELMSTSQSLNISSPFKKQMMTLQGEETGPKGHLSITAEIFEVAPSQFTIELRKSGGDALQFHKFYKGISTGLKDVVWKTVDEGKEEGNVKVESTS
ncbi:unnamed protein product [Linum tenue]|uniref:Protein kinase domain-containing protein n=1 Tax=Linum tenue TaxID=586396 RepID=A0AAV0QIB3_9ROSI|nr:unnamed protein product [Linum tenue]